MKQLKNSVTMNCVLKFNVYLRKKNNRCNGNDIIVENTDRYMNRLYDTIHTVSTSLIPDLQDTVKLLLPERYKNVNLKSYVENGKNIIYMQGKDMELDFTQNADSNAISIYKSFDIVIIEEELIKFAKTNLNKPEWEDGILQKEIVELSLDDIIKIYHQTLHKGVLIN